MSAYMPLDCDGFAAELADYLEGDAPDAVRSAVESHAAECAACRQLLEDLSTIRHDAAALPALVPSRDLWDGIAERIDARVIPMETGTRTIQPVRRSWVRPAIAAAALVIITAGVTHEITRASLDSTPASGAPRGAQPQKITSVATSTTSAAGGSESTSAAPTTTEPVSRGSGAIESTETERGGRSPSPRAQLASSTSRVRVAPARASSAEPLMQETEPVYDREIDKLHRIVKTRRDLEDFEAWRGVVRGRRAAGMRHVKDGLPPLLVMLLRAATRGALGFARRPHREIVERLPGYRITPDRLKKAADPRRGEVAAVAEPGAEDLDALEAWRAAWPEDPAHLLAPRVRCHKAVPGPIPIDPLWHRGPVVGVNRDVGGLGRSVAGR